MQSSATPKLVPKAERPGRLWVFYHYLYPDTVVSALHLDQLAQGLEQRGWDVTGFPCNRSCREENLQYPFETMHANVRLRRIWRPRFRQSSAMGRLLNAAWMIAAWSLLALGEQPPEAIVIGTDPVLSVLTARFWKAVHPETRILHWCFDLYPEAAYADGVLRRGGWTGRLLEWLLTRAYAACDAVADLGPCMRERLAQYGSTGKVDTVVPWALDEPAEVLPAAVEERRAISGDVELSLLYSGTFGRAHTYEGFLALARELQTVSATLTFSVQGNRVPELRAAVQGLPPGSTCEIRFVPFAAPDRLLERLGAPDVHLLSLAADWAGLVVPSKFFGALAVGRPVLFSGSAASSIAQWIEQYQLGWVVTADNVTAIALDLCAYAADPARVFAMQRRCFETYQKVFSRATGLNRMHRLLSERR